MAIRLDCNSSYSRWCELAQCNACQWTPGNKPVGDCGYQYQRGSAQTPIVSGDADIYLWGRAHKATSSFVIGQYSSNCCHQLESERAEFHDAARGKSRATLVYT